MQETLCTTHQPQKQFSIAEKQEERSLKEGGEAEEQAAAPLRAFNRVVEYCTESRCRRAMLLEHFGDKLRKKCSGCDYCDDSAWAAFKVSLVASTISAASHCRAEQDYLVESSGFDSWCRIIWGLET